MAELTIPKFANADEEAAWWFAHRAEVGRDVARASRDGRLGEGSAARMKSLRETEIDGAIQAVPSGSSLGVRASVSKR